MVREGIKQDHSVKEYTDFEEALRKHEIETSTKFVLRKSPAEFTSKLQVTPSEKQTIHWHENTPYYHFGTRVFHCHQGHDAYKSKKKKYKNAVDVKGMNDHDFTKRYKQIQNTKKVDCHAFINVTRVLMLYDFKLEGVITAYRKKQTTQIIRSKMSNGELQGDECYIFNLPPIEAHNNHLMGEESALVEPVDSRVRQHIAEIVQKGERNAVVVSKMLSIFVENELGQVDRTRRRFHPDMKTVRNLVSKQKTTLKASPIDQENVEEFTQNIDCSKHNVYFRPCTVSIHEPMEMSAEPEEQEECNQTKINEEDNRCELLFVYQSAEMKKLYERYGNNTIQLDATYRTSKYAIPLYFLIVKTNVNYQVVGVFITQFETKEAITEALNIFKNWNLHVCPKYAMIDYAAEEISSLKSVFPSIQIFICSFHREQAWTRWFSKSKNCSIPREEGLKLLRNIANATTLLELQQALNCLQTWERYESTPLKTYFESTWLKEIKLWAAAFKPVDMHINTNNGVERMNKELKYNFLEGYKNSSLSEIINVVVNIFLPERYKKYLTENMTISPKCRKYNEHLPNYLHGRPKWFVDRIVTKMNLISSKPIDIEVISEHEFNVPSLTGKGTVYYICFDESNATCSCTCFDFRRERLICKHILQVTVQYPMWNLEKIHSWLFDNPLFKFDETLTTLTIEGETSANTAIFTNKSDSSSETVIITCEEEQIYDKEFILPVENYVKESSRSNEGSIVKCQEELITGLEEFSQNISSTNSAQINKNDIVKLNLRGSKKRHLLNDCNSSLRSIQSAMYYLDLPTLEVLSKSLKKNFKDISKNVVKDQHSGLPANRKERLFVTKKKTHCKYGKIKAYRRKVAGRVGMVADMLKEAKNISVSINNLEPVTEFETTTDNGEHPTDEIILSHLDSNQNITPSPVENVENNLEKKQGSKRKRETDLLEDSIDSVCKRNCLLNDIIINQAQRIIKTQERHFFGFQDTLLGQTLHYDICRQGVQILFDKERQHWVTLKINDETSVDLYDSLGLRPSQSVQKQIAAILANHSSKQITIKVKSVQDQGCTNDCGVFAIAFAHSLSKSNDPCNLSFDSSKMRQHLAHCLRSKFFVDFPIAKTRVKRTQPFEFSMNIYCDCRQPSFKHEDLKDKGLRMAQCNTCREWFHQKCNKIVEKTFIHTNIVYTCRNCC